MPSIVSPPASRKWNEFRISGIHLRSSAFCFFFLGPALGALFRSLLLHALDAFVELTLFLPLFFRAERLVVARDEPLVVRAVEHGDVVGLRLARLHLALLIEITFLVALVERVAASEPVVLLVMLEGKPNDLGRLGLGGRRDATKSNDREQDEIVPRRESWGSISGHGNLPGRSMDTYATRQAMVAPSHIEGFRLRGRRGSGGSGLHRPLKRTATPRRTPLLEPGRVYVHFGTQGTTALTNSGVVLWKTQELRYYHRHGSSGSPALSGRPAAN